jgi:DNA-binding IclR family transcriptional regulator
MERTPVESLRKGLEVLELLSHAPGEEGLSLAEVAMRMDYKRTTAHNLLKTLAMCGYAVNDGEGRYRLGRKVAQLIRNRRAARPVSPELLQPLVQLAVEINENVVLTTLSAGNRRVLARATGQQIVQVDDELLDGEHTLMWEAVTGRVLAAYATEEELDELLTNVGMPHGNWLGVDTQADFARALATIRKAGYAESHERTAASMAVPLLEEGTLLGALGIHLPEFRWQEEFRNPFLNAMRRTAHQLVRLWQS